MKVAVVNMQQSSHDDNDGSDDELNEDKCIQTCFGYQKFWTLDISCSYAGFTVTSAGLDSN